MRMPEPGERTNSFPYRTKYVETSMGRVAYFDEGRGPALVFIHGLAGDFTHFEHVAPAFSDRFRVIGIDMPGCGQSDKLPELTLSVTGFAKVVLELLDALGVARATLIGHSAGGQVSAEIGLTHPSRVERLVLINSAGLRGYPEWLRAVARAIFQPWILVHTLERAAMPMLDYVFEQDNLYTKKFVQDSLGRPRHPLLEEIAKCFHDLCMDLMSPTVRDNASKLAMPVLVVWGEKDRLVELAGVERVAKSFPAGRLEVIRDCGHLPIIETPGAIVRLMRRFLATAEEARIAA